MRSDEPTTTTAELADWVGDARERSFDLVLDLTDEQLMVPKLPTINPLVWELGHAAWFHEKWILRHFSGHEPLRPHVDSLYDSIAIAHEVRWDLPLPSRDDVFAYVAEVRDRVLEELASGQLLERLRTSLAAFVSESSSGDYEALLRQADNVKAILGAAHGG